MKRLSLFVCGFLLVGVSSATIAARTMSAQSQFASALPTESLSQKPSAEQVESKQNLKVGTKEIVPFVFLDDEAPYGYSIELWSEVARDLNLATEWVRYDSVSDMLAGLEAGEIDVAIAGISITAAREADSIDFSYPFYRSGLQLMVPSEQSNRFRSLLRGFLSWRIWKPFLLVMATSAGVGVLIWALEHKHNENFSSNPINGIGQGIWFSIVTLGTFGYGDVTPNKLPARIVACLWMGASFFIVADFIASLTVGQLAESTISFDDLRGEAVGVVDDTTAEIYVRSQPVVATEFDTFDSAIAALEAGDIEAIVHDYPTLKYIANREPQTFQLAGDRLTQEDYGIAFRENNPFTEIVSREILSLQEKGSLQRLREKWFGEDSEAL